MVIEEIIGVHLRTTLFGKNIEHTLIEALSGLAEYKGNTNEIWIKAGCVKNHITVEVVDADNKMLIVRGYFKDGQKKFEAEYTNYKRNGYYKEWDNSGRLICTGEYLQGHRYGWFDYPLYKRRVKYRNGRVYWTQFYKVKE